MYVDGFRIFAESGIGIEDLEMKKKTANVYGLSD